MKNIRMNLILLLIIIFMNACSIKNSIYETTATNSKKYELIDADKNKDNNENFNIDSVRIYKILDLKDTEIIVPKNQKDLQSYSVIFKNKNNELIIFDGGRVEDADYLLSVIKYYGGVVNGWFLSHIHDDHIGALYKILNDKNTDINIKNLYYNFASFDWYYEKIGNDAGALYLFENALNEYKDLLISQNNKINIINKLNRSDLFDFNDIKVEVINDMYKLDSDPINNSTIVYKVYFEDYSLLSLGDLGYYGGEKLMENIDNIKLKSDIVVVSHHGQNGVSEDFYKVVIPKIAIWPTTKKIFENLDKIYNTEDTIEALENVKTKYNIKTYEGTFIIK